MKRYGNIYKKIYEMDNLILAHKMASRDKSFYTEVQMVNSNQEYYLKQIQEILKNKTYSLKQEDYVMFEKNDKGKIRQIYKLNYFPHRIIQWALILQIQDYYMKNYIYYTFSSIPNRGIHLALRKIDEALKGDLEGTKYCLKMDIRKFYPSIDHEINKERYRRKFKDNDLLWLIDTLIDSLCLDDKGNSIPNYNEIPKEDRKGIAIGSLFSQFNGNYYLSGLSHWLKEVKKVKYLYFYCDDIVILGKSKEELHKLRYEIQEYLQNNLKLDLKNNYQVFPVDARGIDFVGYRHFREYILLRKTTSKNLIKKMRKIKKKMDKCGELTFSEWCSINSYKGWMDWADCYNLYKKWIKPLEPYCEKYYKTVILTKSKKEENKELKKKMRDRKRTLQYQEALKILEEMDRLEYEKYQEYGEMNRLE